MGGKEIPVIQSIPKSLAIKNPFDMVIDLVQKVSLATFMIIDHVGLLRQWKILSVQRKTAPATIKMGLKFFFLSNCMGFIGQLRKYFKTDEEKDKERYACLKAAFKHLLLIYQTSHLSGLRLSHDALIGIA